MIILSIFSKLIGSINLLYLSIIDTPTLILNFSLNKCVADIYTLFNYLEREKVYLSDSKLSHKIIICIFPILPKLSLSLNKNLFNSSKFSKWPTVRAELLIEDQINLPVQINGRFATTIQTKKGYDKDVILDTIYKLDKIKNKITEKKIIKVINVQDKIINIIIS